MILDIWFKLNGLNLFHLIMLDYVSPNLWNIIDSIINHLHELWIIKKNKKNNNNRHFQIPNK